MQTKRSYLVLLIAMMAVTAPPVNADEPEGVLTGIDVLVRDGFKPLAGRKIGLITNHTGLSRDGKSTIELLRAAPDLTLVTLFSPEHGLKGVLDEKVGDTTDPTSGLKVYSLYGKTNRPTPEMLSGIDTLVFDIQDIGTRFYTYISTMGLAMEEAARHKLRFVVLDRPNPITGTRAFGPLNDEDGGFTNYHKIPVVHGMTIGELARLFNAERKIGADLHVVELVGWKRSMWFDETGLTWVNPSPNMRSLTEATLYPAIGLLEACNLSVGRGTDTPFEVLGATWIDARQLAGRLNGLGLAGIRFIPYRFTPAASKFKGESCGGVQMLLTDRNAFDPIQSGLSVAHTLMSLFGDKFEIQRVNNLLFNRSVLDAVTSSKDARAWSAEWSTSLDAFAAVRTKHLLYTR